MMQSEQEGQRNLQQSGAAGQRNTQHATNIKKRSMRRTGYDSLVADDSAGSFCRGQNIICARLLKSLECKIRDNTYGRGVSGKPDTAL